MKLIHLSDLHLGKRVNEFPMLEDQRYILTEIINIIDEERPDGVMIAGDVFDKSLPPAEAVELFDDFLVRLVMRRIRVFVISGNHDSPERIAYGGRIMDASGVHLSPVYNGEVKPLKMRDDFGDINIYMLPFIKPTHVRRFFETEDIVSYTDAVRIAADKMNIDTTARNILMTHQFVTGAQRCDSEEVSVGGTDNVDASVFEGFDYVALGHIHRPQKVGTEKIRYCGTPLKYSFSEAKDNKSVTVLEMAEKGNIKITERPLVPLRDMTELRGSYMELTARSFYENTGLREAYVHITLTDEDDIPDAVGRLRTVYPYLMKLDYDNTRTRREISVNGAEGVENKSPLELFAEFYELRNNQPMSEEQTKFMAELKEKVDRQIVVTKEKTDGSSAKIIG